MSALHNVVVQRPDVPQVEVVAKATRRRFTAEYKLKILREAEACTAPGAIGALLRREGLYSSNLTTWREQRQRGPRGPGPRDAREGVLRRWIIHPQTGDTPRDCLCYPS